MRVKLHKFYLSQLLRYMHTLIYDGHLDCGFWSKTNIFSSKDDEKKRDVKHKGSEISQTWV